METGAKRLTAWIVLATMALACAGPMPAAACDLRSAGSQAPAPATAPQAEFPFAEAGLLAEAHVAARLAALLPILLPLVTAPVGDELSASSRGWGRPSQAGVERGLLSAAVAGAVAIGCLVLGPALPAGAEAGAQAGADQDATLSEPAGDPA
jgi:hypothetical protein